MFRNATTTLAAAAIALTGFVTTPAAAGDREDEILKFIAGAAALGVIVHQLDKNGDRRPASGYPSHDGYPPHDGYPSRPVANVLPGECAVDVRTGNGWRVYYVKRCVEEVSYLQLPRSCLRTVRTSRGERSAYGQNCLRDKGFKVEAGYR